MQRSLKIQPPPARNQEVEKKRAWLIGNREIHFLNPLTYQRKDFNWFWDWQLIVGAGQSHWLYLLLYKFGTSSRDLITYLPFVSLESLDTDMAIWGWSSFSVTCIISYPGIGFGVICCWLNCPGAADRFERKTSSRVFLQTHHELTSKGSRNSCFGFWWNS